MRRRLAFWVVLSGLSLVAAGSGDSLPVSPEERVLAEARIRATGPELLEFLRKRTQDRVDPEPLQKLIQHLTGPAAQAERARAELIAYGPVALTALRAAAREDAQVKARPLIEDCLKWIEGEPAPGLVRAVIRRLEQLKPRGTEAALLAFAAREEDPSIEDARRALSRLALVEGKAHPVLVEAALKGSSAALRRTAIDLLCQVEASEVIRKLLQDPARDIRRYTASQRLDQGDGEAVPVLIDLLAGSDKERQEALEPLQRLAGPLAPAPMNPVSARDTWAAWWKEQEADRLLQYFRDRTPSTHPNHIGELVQQLGSKSFRIRTRAEQDLVNLRGLSVPHLEKVLESSDLEVRKRAQRCLDEIRQAPDAARSAANVRLLLVRGPTGITSVLLAYLAFADSETVTDEIRQALRVLVRRDATSVALVSKALEDRAPARRAVAAELLAELGGEQRLLAVRKLLADPEPRVRLAAGVGLARQQERSAITVLIDLLAELPLEQGWTIEELLQRLAGDRAPNVSLEASAEARQKCRDLWGAWWKQQGQGINLAALRDAPTEVGTTLLSLWNGSNVNYVVEMGRDRKERWRINELGYAFDFMVLPGQRLLLAEHNRNRVTERNFKGDVLWQLDISSPINCQRLPNGHTFVVASDRCVLVDRQKNEVVRYGAGGWMGGQRLRDGRVVLINGSGACTVFDASGKQERTFQVQGSMNNYGGVQELPRGRFLLAQHDQNKVSEYDLEGKLCWSCESPSPNFATRLANGHTLIGSQDNRSLIEVDRAGKKVSEYRPEVSVWRVRRR